MSTIDQYLDSHAARFEEELCEFLRIPSVSADPGRRDDMHRAAEWVADQFRRLRFAAEVIPTAGHPLVYAESPAVPGAPTALVYGHYDVQPPDPLEKWITPPFEPTRRDGNLYARGATDDKGQMFTHLKSAEAWITVEGRLPINLKFLIEGEEEVGSQGLEQYHRRARRPAGVRLRGHQRRRPIRPRRAGHHLRAAGHRLLRASRHAAPTATCTPARSAAR